MKNQKRKEVDDIDIFYGFWKYLGVFSIFIIGVVLSWWGANIFINDFFYLQSTLGPIATLSLAPLLCGLALAWLSFVEFLRIVREN